MSVLRNSGGGVSWWRFRLPRHRASSRTSGRASRPVLVIGASLLCGLVAGCAQPDAGPDLGSLNGKLVIDDGVYVYPDRHWRLPKNGGMTVRKAGSLLVWIGGELPDLLQAEFVPAGPTGRLHFSCLWDGDPLWEEPKSGGGRPLTVEIDASRLTPGLHRLTIEREKDLDGEMDRDLATAAFRRIDLKLVWGEMTEALPITANGFVASFLDFGVTGLSERRLDGCLFVGPQRLSQPFTSVSESKMSFVLENRSRETANFSVSVDEVRPEVFTLDARETRRVELAVSSGKHELALEVTGDRDGFFLWGSPQLRAPGEEASSSVFFITLDTTRWDAVAPFSPDHGLTPNLEAFARQATVFPNAWATAPWTLPSHASMFTGLYPSNHGAGVTTEALDREWVTLAELFRNEGYQTAGFIGGHMSSSVFGLAQGFSEYHDPPGWASRGDLVTDAVLEYVDKNEGSPLFVFVNYFDPHGPYQAPARYQEMSGAVEAGRALRDDPVWGPLARGDKGAWQTLRTAPLPSDPDGLAYLRALYLAEVAYMDAQIGRLFERLRETGLYDEALIVLVADHGEFLGEHGLTSHSYRLDPELTHVPLLIKRPKQNRGEVINDLVSHVDLFTSVAREMGIEAPTGDGLSLQPISNAAASREYVLMEEHASRIHPLLGPFRVADHLYGLQWTGRREVLFDDRIECRDLQDGSWVPVECKASWVDRLAMLSERMQAAAKLRADHAIADLDQEEAEKLRALGYIE